MHDGLNQLDNNDHYFTIVHEGILQEWLTQLTNSPKHQIFS